ncbi:ABC transporter ATP-binding protein [Pseudonocardia sp. MH-G8]|uniref:ABC transporter ATP-binding protein n=1 Tax=Pseudonocardia sp. MH-G8 TaxID=1854588 RepID=UPI000BA0266D|nr:ABC transporter ATP-binding protein [Pseudonocardia sp. MH-G8]OZM83413.1 ABC transporter [Pseudonocardia sp. MH-G8]
MTRGTAGVDVPDVDEGAAELELRGVDKIYRGRSGAQTQALQDISLSVRPGEFISLVGRSGCGKTTLLRILAGLVSPSSGEVLTGGRALWQGGRRDLAASARFGLVFQDANLFPWFSVEDNIALPLKLRGVAKRARRARAADLCELVGLTGFEKSLPRELSGGMRQRAAIARALSYDPSILLMDEPFGALDALTRDRMNLELQKISVVTGATVVFVTHSITEAVFLADRVVLLSPRPGRIRSVTRVEFARPRSLDVESEPGFQDVVRTLRHQLDEEGG